MSRPSPVAGVLAFLGWVVLAALCSVVLLPPLPSLRTAVWGASVVLFAAAVLAPLRSLPVAGLAVAVSGVSSLAFGLAHPAAVAPVPLAAYLAGSALRSIYDLERPPARHGLTPLWRAFASVSAVSALSAFVLARTAYLLVRDVPPPRVVNRLGLDAEQAVAGTVAMLAALFLAAGFHALGVRAGRDRRGARLVDATLAVVALAAGGTAILQKAGLLPHLRAAHWATWGRAQSTFTDPSAAGVGAAGLLVLLADAGSRGGFIGALVSVLVLVLWAATHALAGQKPGVRRRVALSAGTLAILVALAFGAALAWPTGQGGRSALLARISESFAKKEATTLGEPQRLLLYEGALALAREHPVTGSGLGTFRSRFPDAARDLLGTDVSFTDHPPSLYLGVLAETGLAGTLVLALLLAGLLPALGGALSFGGARSEESLRAAGAGAAVVGLLVVFLFGSHLVYGEIAALAGLLTSRLPAPPEGRSARMLGHVLPVAVAGASVLLLGGALARGVETWGADAAFAHAPAAGLWSEEHEPDGRPFRWTSRAAAFRVDAPAGSASVVRLPVRNARPDGETVGVSVFWNDRSRGTVELPHGGWKALRLDVDGPGVVLLAVDRTILPPSRADRRRLGVETGAPAWSP